MKKNWIAEQDYWNSYKIKVETSIEHYETQLNRITDLLNQLNGNSTYLAQLTMAQTATNNRSIQQSLSASSSNSNVEAYMRNNRDNINNLMNQMISIAQAGNGEYIVPEIPQFADTLEQIVYITAEFPNAINHLEIEEAFNNLNNKAVQYANRKNKGIG